MTELKPRGRYGVDAPWVPWLWLGYALLYAVLATAAALLWNAWWWAVALLILFALASAGGAALFWYASARGKFVLWNTLLDSADFGRVHTALDLGCGHGMVAIMTALRFTDASVVGIDLWRSIDQSGNTIAAAEQNTAANGLSGRVRFETGDMTELPYADASFDLVTASLAIHNVRSRAGRRQAINEAIRVLAPGGTLLIADIRRTDEYLADLRAAGLAVSSFSLGWRGWWSGPWMATTAVIAHANAR